MQPARMDKPVKLVLLIILFNNLKKFVLEPAIFHNFGQLQPLPAKIAYPIAQFVQILVPVVNACQDIH